MTLRVYSVNSRVLYLIQRKTGAKKTISFCSSSRLWQSLLLVRLRRRGVVGGLGGSSDGGVVPASNCFQPYYSWQQASEEACKQATSFQLAASKPISHKKCLPFFSTQVVMSRKRSGGQRTAKQSICTYYRIAYQPPTHNILLTQLAGV